MQFLVGPSIEYLKTQSRLISDLCCVTNSRVLAKMDSNVKQLRQTAEVGCHKKYGTNDQLLIS